MKSTSIEGISNNLKKFGLSPELLKNKDILTFFKKFIDTLPFLVIVTDTSDKYRVLLVNKKMANSLGKTVFELIGTSVLDYFPTEVKKKRESFAETTIKTKKPSIFIDNRAGRYFSNEFYPIADDSGKVPYGMIIVRDITKEKKEEQKKIEIKEKYYSSLIENSMDLITIIGERGEILYQSPSLKRILGYDPAEYKGKSVFQNIHSEDLAAIKNSVKKILSKPGLTEKYMFRIKHNNGGWRYFESIANNQLQNKTINGIIINSRDVTERTVAHEEILQAKNYYQNIIDSTSEIIFTVNKDLKVSLWNRAAENITGLKHSKIINKSLKDLNVFENRGEIIDYLNNTYKDKYSFLNEIIINSVYGSKRLLGTSPSIVKNNQGKKAGIVFVCKDITIKDASHGRLIPGNSYLIGGNSNQDTIDIFTGLTKSGWNGLLVTRSYNESVVSEFGNDKPELLILGSSGEGSIETIDKLVELEERIRRFVTNNKKPLICLNRLDYLLVRFSFEELMQTLYKINDIITKYNALFLIYVNKNIFSQNQFVIIEEEFNSLPSRQVKNIYLEDKLSNILDFIYQETRSNRLVFQKKIEKEFSISKLTTMRKLEELLDKGLISYVKKGRMKSYSVTDKGRELLKNRYSL